jgi:phospholipid/cholesterol/gamma-HCH transport system substrate-binding protein
VRRALAILVVVAAAAGLPACGLGRGGDRYTLTAHFPRAVSVFPSGDVRVLGLPAGEVTKVEVEGDNVLVELSIDGDIKVPKGARAQIVPQSLIGERYIQLSPAYEDGMDAMEDGEEIADTIVPVEPDEALAALKEFLDSLDPNGIGELVSNLEEDLRGNGAALNDTLGEFSHLVETFADNDDVLLRIVDSFDELSATLVTREDQLGQVLDAFSAATDVLADERESITELVDGLAHLSQTGLRLVGEHSTALRADIQTLSDAAATIDANLSSVTTLLKAGNLLTTGLLDAYNPDIRAIDLRNDFGPLVFDLVEILSGDLGLPGVCEFVPVLGCPSATAQGAGPATPARVTASSTPVGSLLTLLSSGSEPVPASRSTGDRIRGWVDEATATLVGEGS